MYCASRHFCLARFQHDQGRQIHHSVDAHLLPFEVYLLLEQVTGVPVVMELLRNTLLCER